MSEKQKSLWKKSWQGPRAVLLLLAAMALTPLVVNLIPAFVCDVPMGKEEWLLAACVGAGFAGCGLLILGLVRAFRWLCFWRNLRRFLFVAVCTFTAIALFYAEENWRGQRAWKQFKREWEAKGERFDLPTLAPPPVPDDQNFAMAPIWVETVCATTISVRERGWYSNKVAALGHTNFTQRLAMPVDLWGRGLEFTNSSGDWQKGERQDLKLWQDYYRRIATVTNFFPSTAQPQTPAEDVLLALGRYDSTIEELRRASELPHSRFPINYADADPASILLPHLASFKGCAMTLRLRALAELEAGQAEKALDDVELMLRLAAAIRTEPILISHLVRIGMLRIILQPVWEGLGDHRWPDAQLARLETELGKLDFLADYQFAMRGERAFDVGMIDYARGLRHVEWLGATDNKEIAFDSNYQFQMWLANFAPAGWFEQNKVACCRMNLDLLVPIVNQETRVVSPAAEARATHACNEIRLTPFNWLTRLLLPALTKCSGKFTHAQAVADLARIACALERYRLAHGEYPESLGALTPQFLVTIPHDIIGGQPLKYRRTDDGQFLLYSVGWNGTDDGGKVALEERNATDRPVKGEPAVSFTAGDWVWRYPAK